MGTDMNNNVSFLKILKVVQNDFFQCTKAEWASESPLFWITTLKKGFFLAYAEHTFSVEFY